MINTSALGSIVLTKPASSGTRNATSDGNIALQIAILGCGHETSGNILGTTDCTTTRSPSSRTALQNRRFHARLFCFDNDAKHAQTFTTLPFRQFHVTIISQVPYEQILWACDALMRFGNRCHSILPTPSDPDKTMDKIAHHSMVQVPST